MVMQIQTYGNRCFTDRGLVKAVDRSCRACSREKCATRFVEEKVVKEKPEKVNLKFGKIRVQVSNAKKVRVKQDGDTMVVLLDTSDSKVD